MAPTIATSAALPLRWAIAALGFSRAFHQINAALSTLAPITPPMRKRESGRLSDQAAALANLSAALDRLASLRRERWNQMVEREILVVEVKQAKRRHSARSASRAALRMALHRIMALEMALKQEGGR